MKMLAQVDIGGTFNSPFGVTGGKTIGDLVSVVIGDVFVVVGVILLIIFIVAGISMIAGAGKSDPREMEKAKQAATSAVIGFIIIFVAYWVIQLIEIITGVKIMSPVF